MNEELLESFYSAIGEEKKPVKSHGQTVGYWSIPLRDELIKSINENHDFTSSVKKMMSDLVTRNDILPVYTHDIWALEIAKMFFQVFIGIASLDAGLCGFYDGKQIVLMISNLRNMNGPSGNISQSVIYDILTHELQHRFAAEVPNYYNDSLVKKILDKWVSALFEVYFENDLEKDAKKDLMAFFIDIKSESNRSVLKNHIPKRYNLLVKTAKKYSNRSWFGALAKLINYTYHCYRGNPNHNDYAVFQKLREVYKKTGIESNTFIYQEMLVASEVICVTAASDRSVGNELLSRHLDKLK